MSKMLRDCGGVVDDSHVTRYVSHIDRPLTSAGSSEQCRLSCYSMHHVKMARGKGPRRGASSSTRDSGLHIGNVLSQACQAVLV